ncbi:hypothetical protein IWW55_002450 [Coemansia sp. RSA 2706]|nr:hypothetical protein IWW55_002450 [Coemansia sp. RSA 2706]KAJ2313450.1 hypothetical protein IWW54_001506 [Coemansia sp. RSA 2705]KAJ2366309.1 hypothetical protein H4S01_002779 [Coemansia sp. RSA 2610]KAJ2389492.1 hypothetical protein H4S02_002337 [Coemansia sp. RSA 2611]
MAEIQSGGTHSPLPPQPQLFQLEPIDVAEPWQHELVECFISFSTLSAGKSQIELHETLQQKASESMHSHGELVNGLVYGILTVPAEGNTYLRHLNIVSRDGFAHAISRLKLLATAHRFARVRPEVRLQLFWLLSELVKVSAHGMDQVVLALTRQVRSGDVTQGNVKLCWLMVRFAQANYVWLSTFPVLVATTVYMLGRVALDHSRIPDLRAAECELATRLLRERFHECCMIGRDLVRMLQDVARIPEFHDLWQDMLQRPQSLSPLFAGIEQLLRTPTPPMFLANRITYEMESRLRFILENLPATSYSRNLMWFVQRCLSTPESESLFSDLIRYIIGVFHPSNVVLASNVVPRYVFLGGLLRFIRSPVVAANAKLALFYDWLFYDPKSDTIMNIEPGVLIIAQSVDKYTFMTASFIEFLAYESDAYSPELAPAIRGSIGLAMQDAVEKGVIPSIMPIYEHPRIEVDIRQNLYYLFPQLVPPVLEPVPSEASADDAEPAKNDDAMLLDPTDMLPPAAVDSELAPEPLKPAVELPLPKAAPQPARTVSAAPKTSIALDPVSRMFQEEFGMSDIALASEGPTDADNTNGISDTTAKGGALEDVVLVASAEPLPEISVEQALEDTSLWLFGSTLQTFVDSVAAAEPDVKQIGGSVKEIVDMFAQSEASISAITRILASIFSDSLDMEDAETNAELAAAGESSDGLEHDLLHYILTAAADYAHTTDMTNSTRRVLQLLVQLTETKVDVGFCWLLYSVVNAGKPAQYARYVEQYAEGTLQAALVRDLGVLQEQFPGLFYTVLPQIYAAFPDAFPGCRGIVKSVVALIDQPQVYRLGALIARGQLQLFGHRQAAITAIIGMTLESDAFEQVCFWQLLNAEVSGDEMRVASIAHCLLLEKELDPASNSEAATGLLTLLKATLPTPSLLNPLFMYAAATEDSDAGVDFSGNVLTAWLRTSKAALLNALSEVAPSALSTGVVKSVVSRWLERYSQQLDEKDRYEIQQALVPKSAAPVIEVPDLSGVERSSEHRPVTRSQKAKENNERKHRISNSQPISRQQSHQETPKRRKQTGNTSDSNDSSSDVPMTRGRRRRNGRSLTAGDDNQSYQSSPILSSVSSSD